jgi:hypothetical protein
MPDDSVFCQNCGVTLIAEDSQQKPPEAPIVENPIPRKSFSQNLSETPVQRQNREPHQTTRINKTRSSHQKKKTNLLYIIIPVVAIAVAAGVLYFLLNNRGNEENNEVPQTPENNISIPTIEPEHPTDQLGQEPSETVTDTQPPQEPDFLPQETESPTDQSTDFLRDGLINEVAIGMIPARYILGHTREGVIDVLGEPYTTDMYDNFHYHNYIIVFSDFGSAMAITSIYLTDGFDADGLSLNLNRDGLVQLFGNPSEEDWTEYDQYQMRYYTDYYSISFTLSTPEEAVIGIVIWYD